MTTAAPVFVAADHQARFACPWTPGGVPVKVIGFRHDGTGTDQLGGLRPVIRFRSGAEVTVPAHMLSGCPDLPSSATVEAYAHRGVGLSIGQYRVLTALVESGANGLTDDDHEDINGLRGDSAGKRRLELKAKGYVAEAHGGAKRSTRRGALAHVWIATAAGREVHAQMRRLLINII